MSIFSHAEQEGRAAGLALLLKAARDKGMKDERANNAALLNQAAERFEKATRELIDEHGQDRCRAKASELRTMAAYIQRGARADTTDDKAQS